MLKLRWVPAILALLSLVQGQKESLPDYKLVMAIEICRHGARAPNYQLG